MRSEAVAVLKTGVWCQFGATDGTADSFCGAWAFEATPLLQDQGFDTETVAMSDGSTRFYPASTEPLRVTLRGVVLSDHTKTGVSQTGSVANCATNIAALRSVLATGRGSGDGTMTITVKSGSSTLGTVAAAVGSLTVGNIEGDPAECTAVVPLLIKSRSF